MAEEEELEPRRVTRSTQLTASFPMGGQGHGAAMEARPRLHSAVPGAAPGARHPACGPSALWPCNRPGPKPCGRF